MATCLFYPWERKNRMRQMLSPLILGALAGGIIIGLFNASTMEQLYWEKEKLRVELFETTERLAKMESLWEDHQEGEIISVSIELKKGLNAFTELALRQALNEISSGLIGEQINEMNPELILALYQNREVTVEDKDYLVTVNWVIIARETVVSLSAAHAGG